MTSHMIPASFLSRSSSRLPFRRMRHLLWTGVMSGAIAMMPAPAAAVPIESVTNPREAYGGWVSDEADLLSDATEAELNQMISALEAENGSEIAVVTVSDTAPSATPKTFATDLFNDWGIGKAETDNGILFLISEGDRRVELEIGYGMESILPKPLLRHILNTEILPPMAEGDFDQGALAGTVALIDVVAADGAETFTPGSPNSGDNSGANAGLNSSANSADAPAAATTNANSGSLASSNSSNSRRGVGQYHQPGLLPDLSLQDQYWVKGLQAIPLHVRLAIGGFALSGLLIVVLRHQARRPIWLKPGTSSRYSSSHNPDDGLFWCEYLAGTSGLTAIALLVGGSIKALFPGLMISLIAALPLMAMIERKTGKAEKTNKVGDRSSSRGSSAHAHLTSGPHRPRRCETCQQTLTKVSDGELMQHLSQPKQIAKKLNSVKFEGWNCAECKRAGRPHIHTIETVLSSNVFCYCPNCRELTVKQTTKLNQPTFSSTGKRIVTKRCYCCDYERQTETLLPRKVKRSYSSRSGYYGGGYGGGYGGCGGGGGGGGGYGGGFGGGSSGGGGCGGGF